MTNSIDALAAQVVATLAGAQRKLCTAESCTGGWIAKALTDIPGSSDVFELGFVTYSNAVKTSQLQVPPIALETHGAVSEQVVRGMATGALELSGADLAVAVSGIAGPGGGSSEKPVGTVWFAWADATETTADVQQFDGDRQAVRAQAVEHALRGVLARA